MHIPGDLRERPRDDHPHADSPGDAGLLPRDVRRVGHRGPGPVGVAALPRLLVVPQEAGLRLLVGSELLPAGLHRAGARHAPLGPELGAMLQEHPGALLRSLHIVPLSVEAPLDVLETRQAFSCRAQVPHVRGVAEQPRDHLLLVGQVHPVQPVGCRLLAFCPCWPGPPELLQPIPDAQRHGGPLPAAHLVLQPLQALQAGCLRDAAVPDAPLVAEKQRSFPLPGEEVRPSPGEGGRLGGVLPSRRAPAKKHERVLCEGREVEPGDVVAVLCCQVQRVVPASRIWPRDARRPAARRVLAGMPLADGVAQRPDCILLSLSEVLVAREL
mmetsp:Transcript_61551/g.179898  ORF Transcript_61551/g.179898 Transcript_61551/m.179898 type:complete len:327 (+) Transcript_61551:680-1660(+)